ncbi:phospholipid scramblase-related protein [Zavarzinella formosa]|uniref:phospholipid scramblase-related protein n=1 Tax=Zavarzinella formosa TaxID=360055 RepID=UPI0002FB9F1E|nr:phospholipid scramblase-related protein [Zavarzinella formosa]
MLKMRQFFVKERTGMFKTSNAYDILNPDTQEKVGLAQEKPSMLMRMIFKEKAPTLIEMRDTKEQLVFKVQKPLALFGRPKIAVFDADNKQLGYFLSKRFSLGGGFDIYTPEGKHIAELKGNWKAKEYKMLTPEQKELGKISKKWAGLAKELFTSSDNYVVGVNDDVTDENTTLLLLAGALTIDMVLKE